MIKRSIQELLVLNVCEPHNIAKYVKQKWIELKEFKNNSTIIVGGFNIPLLVIDKTKQKMNKNIEELKKNIN